MWQNAHDTYDEKDRIFKKIRKEYKNLVRNIWIHLIKIMKKFWVALS